MNYKVGKSSKGDLNEAIAEATMGLKSPKLILFFSNVEHFEVYTEKMKDKFENSIVIGATTFAGFCRDGAYKDALMVMGLRMELNVMQTY